MPIIKNIKVKEEHIVDPLKVYIYDPETGRKVLVSSTRVLPTMGIDFLIRRGELGGFSALRIEWHGIVNGSVYNLQDGSYYYPADISYNPSWLMEGSVPPGSTVNITRHYLVAEDYGGGMIIEWGPGTFDKSMKFPVATDNVAPAEIPLVFHEGTVFRIGFYATKKNQTPYIHAILVGFVEPG